MTRRLPALFILLFFAVCLFAPVESLALHPDEKLADPVLESRARAITREVRCLVCQGEAIDDSRAPLAADLRRLVRARLAAGDSDEEVRRYLVARYGDYVLLRPPVRAGTFVLWGLPFAVFALGAAVVVVRVRRAAERRRV